MDPLFGRGHRVGSLYLNLILNFILFLYIKFYFLLLFIFQYYWLLFIFYIFNLSNIIYYPILKIIRGSDISEGVFIGVFFKCQFGLLFWPRVTTKGTIIFLAGAGGFGLDFVTFKVTADNYFWTFWPKFTWKKWFRRYTFFKRNF